MRVTIIAPGSRGDVEPYLALAKGLTQSGHTARLVTHENFETLVRSNGVAFWPMEGSAQEIAQSTKMSALLERGNFFAIMRLMAKEAERGARAMIKGGLAACQDADLIVAGVGGIFIGTALAEKVNIPLLQAYYIPFSPTRAYPSFLIPRLPFRLGGTFNRFSYELARQVMWQSFRLADRTARRDVLGLPPASFWGPYHSPHILKDPILYAYSPSVIPPPPDWEHAIVTGYWFLDPANDWSPSAALADFLQSGPPPVYIGFGSMSTRKPEETASLILSALARTGQRAIILSGWGGLRPADAPKSVLMIDSAPFSWLFPRVAAVVHHGGAGTTAAGLRAGVPSVVVPFFGDQPYWGQCVADLGAGTQPIPRKNLSAERLANAIEQAVNDTAMRQRAAELGAKIRAENGIARAIAAIEQIKIAGQMSRVS